MTEENSLPEEAATGCGGKMKVGLAKGFWGETRVVGMGEGGRRVEAGSCIEGREEMGVVTVLESVGDAGGVVLLLGTVKGLGGRGG